MMNNKCYDVLKFIAQIFLPALATLWYTIAMIWNLPYAEPIMYTLVAVDTFLGALLGISSIVYNSPKIKADEGDDVNE